MNCICRTCLAPRLLARRALFACDGVTGKRQYYAQLLLHLTQAIVFCEGKSVGRILSPKVRLSSGQAALPEGPQLQLISLTYDFWQPISQLTRKPEAQQYLAIGLERLKRSTWTLQIWDGRSGSACALPLSFGFDGSATAAAVDTHIQRLHYIQEQHRRFSSGDATTHGSLSHPVVWGQTEYTVETGEVGGACAMKSCADPA